jgi:hypothetical protein
MKKLLLLIGPDEAASDTNGQEAGDVWFVVEPAEPTE